MSSFLKSLNLILLGGPGSGKGTQAVLIKHHFHLEHISTGEMFRQEIAKKTKIGLLAQSIIAQGDLCSDELTIEILHDCLNSFKNPKGFIFDGVPRTLVQAEMMDNADNHTFIPINRAFYLHVNEEEIVKRIVKRAKEENRSDDTPEIVRHRIDNYNARTLPLINYYKKRNKLIDIDGMQNIEKVFMDISHHINQYLSELE